ncbi:MAG: Stp1/IreP family PP2C-type Ser/Thr phosphatase [Acidobacteria bacterium]|nr:Stp1/IreP family PP2C-type Ser/Thr phosphatase [Acidobacteriota bacterium]
MSEHSADTERGGGDRSDRTFLRVRMAMRSDVGRVRSENQDFAIVAEGSGTGADKGDLMVVADGMGGHKGGATASRLAATTIRDLYFAAEGHDVSAILRDAIIQANSVIHQQAAENEDLEGMGTTASTLVIREGRAWVGHVGDSRIYRIRNHEIEQITDDHSLVATMVREGLLSPEEAETHPRRNVLQRSMGVSSEVEADVEGPFDLAPGDRFILCSDGLHGLVSADEISDVVIDNDVERAADRLIELALDRGAHDNVTVIVASVETADDSVETSSAAEGDAEDETAVGGAAGRPSSTSPSMGAGGCLLRTLLIGFSIIAIAGSFFLLVAGDLFASWFLNIP